MISSDFWRGRRVFVTGHTGFKGAWLALMLDRLNASVTGFALQPPTTPNLFDLTTGGHQLIDRRGDIGDLATLGRAMREAQAEIVIHMAAQPLVRWGYAHPVETYRTNVIGTVNVLEAARDVSSVRTIVVVTTDKCYENQEWSWGYREIDRLGGYDPYSNSKACAELAVSAYRRSFFAESGVRIVTARAGNVIGGGDFAADRILPDAYRAFQAGEPLSVRNPWAVRPWQHVLEPLHGYLLLAEAAATGRLGDADAFNFGPGLDGERDVAGLLNRFAVSWGGDARWTADPKRHPHEANLLRLDTSRARTMLGWAPHLSFDEAVGWTAEWYRAFAAEKDMLVATLKQVDAFMGLCVRLTSPFRVERSPDLAVEMRHVG